MISCKNPPVEEIETHVARLEKQYAACLAEKESLIRGRKEFLSIFNSIDALIYISDPKTYELLYANRMIRKEFCHSGNILGKKCYRVLQNRDQPCRFCANPIIFRGNASQPYIHEICNPKNGRWYHCIDKVIRWIDGRMVRFEVAIDIHDRKIAVEALEESQKIYSTLVENAQDGVTIIQDGLRKFSNRAMVSMSGYEQDEIVGKPFVDIIAPAYKAPVEKMLQKALENNSVPPLYESKIVAKDGRLKDIEASISPIRYEGRLALMAIIRDISERKQLAESLYDSEERYQVLHDYLNIYIPLHLGCSDRDYKFKLWNKYSEKMLGYSEEEVIGKLTPADIHEIESEARDVVRIAEEKGIYDKEINFRHKNGSLVPVHLVVVPKKNKQGEVIGLYGFAEDITIRKKAETALRESEKSFRDLVENALMGISIYQDGKIVYENSEQSRIYGFFKHDANLQHFEKLIHPNDIHKFRELYSFLYPGNSEGMDTVFRFYPTEQHINKAEMKWVQFRANRIEYRGRDAVLMNMMDITRVKQMENLLNIEDKMTSLGRVAAGMAHEIRSPLSGINLLLANLKTISHDYVYIDGKMLEEIQTIADKVMDASQKIESVVKRVLDFTRPSEVHKKLIDINQPVEEAIKLSAVTMRKEGIEIEKHLPDKIPPCHADARLIEQVLLNLITNAIQAMSGCRQSKYLGISSAVEGGYVVIRVADSGAGVPLAVCDKIFDPYFSTKSKGSGIGLSLSRRIIQDHQGTLEVAKSRWNGAEFVVRLPLPLSSATIRKEG